MHGIRKVKFILSTSYMRARSVSVRGAISMYTRVRITRVIIMQDNFVSPNE